MRRLQARIERYFGRSRNVSRVQVDVAAMRTLQRLRQDPMWESDAPVFTAAPAPAIVSAARKRSTRWVQVAAAAVVFIIAGGLVVLDIGGGRSFGAVVEIGESSIYLVADGQTRRLQPNERVAFGDAMRSNGGIGGMLRLSDGSRIEMRAQSELTVERADDGIRIRLGRGGVIVNAAKQRDGHLYVQTKDVIVSVVGTVFLVNAEEAGSRVAVIQGEVRVEDGVAVKTLLPGNQTTTNPSLPVAPLPEAIAWSRNATALFELLQQSAVIPPPIPPQRPEPAREKFVVASIRINTTTPSGGRGTPVTDGPCAGKIDIDPARVAVTRATVNFLIALAYGYSSPFGGGTFGCSFALGKKRFSGVPDWVDSLYFDVEASIPDGPAPFIRRPAYVEPLPRLSEMFRALLEERFRLVVRREWRNSPVYLLSAAPEGPRLTPSKPGGRGMRHSLTPAGLYERYKNNIAPARPYDGLYVGHLSAQRGSMQVLAAQLQMFSSDRIVIDRTGITGDFDYELFFAPVGPIPADTSVLNIPLSQALKDELGLELKPSVEPVEFLVVERLERPTGN